MKSLRRPSVGVVTFAAVLSLLVAVRAARAQVTPPLPPADPSLTPARPPAARPVTLGVRPVTSSIDPRFHAYCTTLELALGERTSTLKGVQLVDRSRVTRTLDELALAGRNRGDLATGRWVG